MPRKPHITVDDLVQIAEDARQGNRTLDEIARSFVSALCGRIEGRFGKDDGDRLARALGFDHLIEE